MPTQAPPRRPEQEELDALIEEARRRARRRRLGYAGLVLAVLALGGLYIGFHNGGGGGATSIKQPEPSNAGPPGHKSQARSKPVTQPVTCAHPGRAFTGDVDGDGTADRVRIVGKRTSSDMCSFALSVDTAYGELRYVLGERALVEAPPIDRLVNLDRRPGLEIVADPTEGASTAFAAVYTFSAGRLVQMRIAGQPRNTDTGSTFPYGGSVMHFNGVDCYGRAGTGVVVASGASAYGPDTKVERQFLSVARKAFHPVPSRTERFHLRRPIGGSLSRRFPELISTPFASCSRGT